MAVGGETQTSQRLKKSRSAFRTISEVSADLDVPQHVLRFWESKFQQVKPLKRGGGRRYYRPEDVDLLRRIRELLYRDGYTIKGVQRLLRERGAKAPGGGEDKGPAAAQPRGLSASKRAVIEEVLQELTEIRDTLRGG